MCLYENPYPTWTLICLFEKPYFRVFHTLCVHATTHDTRMRTCKLWYACVLYSSVAYMQCVTAITKPYHEDTKAWVSRFTVKLLRNWIFRDARVVLQQNKSAESIWLHPVAEIDIRPKRFWNRYQCELSDRARLCVENLQIRVLWVYVVFICLGFKLQLLQENNVSIDCRNGAWVERKHVVEMTKSRACVP